MGLGLCFCQTFEKAAARAHPSPLWGIRILLRQGMGKRVCCMTAFMRGRGGSSGHGCFRMSRAIFSGSASPHAHCLRPRRARRDAAAAAAQCALQCMLAGTQRRRLTEWVLSVPNVRGPSTGRVGRLSACQARAALAHTPSIFRWSFFFYYSPVVLPQDPDSRLNGCQNPKRSSGEGRTWGFSRLSAGPQVRRTWGITGAGAAPHVGITVMPR